jgi:hypothetical protein
MASSLGLLFFSVLAANAYADSFTDLATANFAVLGASTVTNVPTSTITGNVGVWSSGGANAITGFGAVANTNVSNSQVSGTVDSGTAAPMAAQGDASSAYTTLMGLSGTDLTGQNLGGLTLNAGVYNFSSSAQLTGTLTLNFGGASGETIVIDTVSSLTTAPGSSVVLEGWNPTDSVYWAVGSQATIDTTTSFEGNVIAYGEVVMNTDATDGCGSVTSLTDEVTLQMNTISTGCNGATTTTGGGQGPTPTPEGGSPLLYLSLFLVPIGAMRAFGFRTSSC